MGHEIGLHFDSDFYEIYDESSLSLKIAAEAEILERLYGVKPAVFSFHNPVAEQLSCEDEVYGGLINCYSRRFKNDVTYCSDSNGYWRFRRLRDVLVEAKAPCLQVLTHPGWWQDLPMPPRQRIFRSVYGRAAATMRDNDTALDSYGRLKQSVRRLRLKCSSHHNRDNLSYVIICGIKDITRHCI